MLKRIDWGLVGWVVGGLTALAGLIWFLIWMWAEHTTVVVTLIGVAFTIGMVVAATTDNDVAQRQATAAAAQMAAKERAAAEEANQSGLTPAAPAGWYPDPTGPGRERWWSGTSWETRSRHSPSDA